MNTNASKIKTEFDLVTISNPKAKQNAYIMKFKDKRYPTTSVFTTDAINLNDNYQVLEQNYKNANNIDNFNLFLTFFDGYKVQDFGCSAEPKDFHQGCDSCSMSVVPNKKKNFLNSPNESKSTSEV